MQPSTAITRLDLGLTQSEFSLAADRQGFIGPKVLPVILVNKQAADFGKIPLESLLKTQDTKRAPRAGYNRDDADFDKNSYSTDDHGLEAVLDDRQAELYRDLIDGEMFSVDRAVDGVLRRYEIDVASAVNDTSVWTGSSLTTAIINEWDDFTNATPITDVDAAREKVFSGTGLEPNALIINRFVMRNLRNCAQIVDKIKYVMGTLPGEITAQMLATAFDIKYVIVAGSAKNGANEAQAASISRIWSNEYAMVAKVAETNDPMEPCLGHTFTWNGDGAPAGPGSDQELAVLVEEYRSENNRGTVYRARNDRGIKIMYKEAAHLLSNVTT
jgi:hypothetical protein